MAPSRKCILPGCQALPSTTVCLFTFPKNEEQKQRWIDFVKRHCSREVKITSSNTFLCSQHFTPESFSNLQRRQLGFTNNPLMLVSGVVPTIAPPPPDSTSTLAPPSASGSGMIFVRATASRVSFRQCFCYNYTRFVCINIAMTCYIVVWAQTFSLNGKV